ncbi:hypothetical protein [Klenkia soli]|nr:hypothetical protein [Klenkia soli]
MRLATVGKLLGVAGLAGVAATGAVLARDERQRRAYTPDDVRARLHARAEAATTAEQFARQHGEPTPELVAVPAERGAGLWFIPRATTLRGRLAQRVRQLRLGPSSGA